MQAPNGSREPERRALRWWPALVAAALVGALALRLAAAASTPLSGDEEDRLKAARVYRFVAPTTLAEGPPAGAAFEVNHPLLAVALVRLPLALGFESPLAIRLPFVVLSVLGLWCAYALAQAGFGRFPAFLALALLSVDQFHLIRSRTASEAVALAFVPPILFVFHRAVSRNRPNLMALVGLLVGLGYHGKEDTLLLLAPLALFLALKRDRRAWFRRKETYLALAIVAGFVGIDLYLNVTGSAHNLDRLFERTAGVGLTLRATSLYLGELLIRLVKDPARFVWVLDRWSEEVPAMNWVAGLVCLAAVIQATGRYRDELTSLLLWVFYVVFCVASMVAPVHGFFELDMTKWAGATVIPAAILTGDLVYRRARAWRLGQVLAVALVGFLIGNGVRVALIRENVYSLPPEVRAMRPWAVRTTQPIQPTRPAPAAPARERP